MKELGGDGVAGLEAEGYGDVVGLAVVGFVEAVEHAVHSVALVTVLCGPLGNGDSALAETLFDLVRGQCLLGSHGGGSLTGC